MESRNCPAQERERNPEVLQSLLPQSAAVPGRRVGGVSKSKYHNTATATRKTRRNAAPGGPAGAGAETAAGQCHRARPRPTASLGRLPPPLPSPGPLPGQPVPRGRHPSGEAPSEAAAAAPRGPLLLPPPLPNRDGPPLHSGQAALRVGPAAGRQQGGGAAWRGAGLCPSAGPAAPSPIPAGTWRGLSGLRDRIAHAVLEADLAEAAGHGRPEAAGGAAEQTAALASEGGEVVHGGGAPDGRGDHRQPAHAAPLGRRPRFTTWGNFGVRPRLHLKEPRRRRSWVRAGPGRQRGTGRRGPAGAPRCEEAAGRLSRRTPQPPLRARPKATSHPRVPQSFFVFPQMHAGKIAVTPPAPSRAGVGRPQS